MPDQENNQLRTVPQSSEGFGNLPNDSESFRNVPHAAEVFRTIPKPSERTEHHILTVREAARMFEAAGVARTERSITNWCQPNRTGVARLDAYFDSNDRKYFITPQSIDAAIKEELAKVAKHSDGAEGVGTLPNPSEQVREQDRSDSRDSREMDDLRYKLREAEISSRVKDQYIARLETQQEKTIEQLVSFSRTIGQLETKLLQIEPPSAETVHSKRIHVVSESEQNETMASQSF